ncbi:Panacea domain-containing protein [Epilithonimonas hungarica]|uniref:Uncharacterized phage-associated protein n=1 Tax=Epilithonimonas hungarica TaxID=454006 RepID=A0A1G7F896_9FLAO|nr:Panacea domain-containing protein [Epilithonimonas hungarica]SDE72112.1 Uncharacterized phage-associated protein [Epilithonimonas hungarica]
MIIEHLQTYIQPILYVLNKAGKALDTHKISKILYFADREHLAKYGTSISNDTYMKMQYGPVPSTIYDIIKAVQGKGGVISKSDIESFFEISEEDKIIAKVNFDEDEFSKSEMECLDNSINEHLSKSFGYLSDKSHDDAWKDAIYSMDDIKIAKAGGADENMIKYIMHYNELINSKFI